ncbi:MAG: class I SAM-dependent methyltransferase, partial [Candidatus Omnitrophica bacterium]|nr:class I SAM-dependent methyltransferase [Candidatus Omnitrophota bacterium]
MNKKLKKIFKKCGFLYAVRTYYFFYNHYIKIRTLLLFLIFKIRLKKGSLVHLLLKECWNNFKIDPYPIDRRMNIIAEKKIYGMSTENVRFMVNELVRRFAGNGVYLEIGTFQGGSLLSAALYNPGTRCIGFDNFSEFDSEGINENILYKNLSEFNFLKNIEFYKKDYKKGLNEFFNENPGLKIDVFFYDGPHTFEDHFQGLKQIIPYLNEKCIIIIDDTNYPQVERASDAFLRSEPEFDSVFRLKTKHVG